VSPRNIRLTQDWLAKLIDFGAVAPFGESEDLSSVLFDERVTTVVLSTVSGV
jgi:hypothetical protein